MRIITDYWDYYDSVQAYAGDTKDIFFRKRKPHGAYPLKSTNTGIVDLPKTAYYSSGATIIGFCGKLYPIKVKYNLERAYDYGNVYRYHYNDYEINKDFTVLHGMKDIIAQEKYSKSEYTNHINTLLNSNLFKDLFMKQKVPLFVATRINGGRIDYDRYEINYAPILKNYHFDEIFPEYQAFQEIEVFMANVLNNRENPDPKITDSLILRDAKGFDDKSFKNGPKKRGRKK